MRTNDAAKPAAGPTARRGQLLKRVATNLYRSDITKIYYGIFKAGGKQYHLSLRTTDREAAERTLKDKRGTVGRISSTDGRKLPLAEYDDQGRLMGGLAKQWIDSVAGGVDPSTRDRYLENIRQLSHGFSGMTARGIGLAHVDRWAKGRTDCSANTFNKELEVLRRILDYGMERGLRPDNPARRIKRRKLHPKQILIPTRDEFGRLLEQMRANGAEESADLAELLATSGCRKSEVTGCEKYQKPPLRWQDIVPFAEFVREEMNVDWSQDNQRKMGKLGELPACCRSSIQVLCAA